MCKEAIIDLYERHAYEYDRDRRHSLHGERAWLDQFLLGVPAGGTVLDVGCGTGAPIAAYILQRGFRVVGVDASPSMIQMCRARFPECEWVLQDMRALELGQRFDAILAWDSFFHLGMEEQRAMFPRFAAHALPGSPLLFTSGPREGEAIGSYCGEPLYHASLDPAEYRRLLSANGYALRAHIAEDPACGEHTVWLADYEASA
jgi:SAM-dependent methyltransferase